MSIAFWVAGEPAPQAAGTTIITKTGGRFRAGSNRSLTFWRLRVAQEAQRKAHDASWLYEVPLELSVQFALPRPKSYPKTKTRPHITKPDLKNLVWAVEDALKGILYADDRQIVGYRDCRKAYAVPDQPPGAWIKLTIVSGNADAAKEQP